MTDKAIFVSIELLRNAATSLLDMLEESQGGCISFDQDYFWDIPFEKRVDPTELPSGTDLTLGQISFDLDSLRDSIADVDGPLPYSMVWLGNIFRMLGDQG